MFYVDRYEGVALKKCAWRGYSDIGLEFWLLYLGMKECPEVMFLALVSVQSLKVQEPLAS